MQSLAELRKALREARKEELPPVSRMTADAVKAELAKRKAKDEDSDSEHDMPAALPRRAVSKDLAIGLISKMGTISPQEQGLINASDLPEEYKKKLRNVQIVKTTDDVLNLITPTAISELKDVIKKLKHANPEDAKKILKNYLGEPTTVAPSIPKKPKSRSPSPKMETKAITNPLSIKYAPRKK